MRVALITGGAGFIGSHLAEKLVADAVHVDVLDDLSTGRLSNLDALRRAVNLHVSVAHLNNEPIVRKLVARADVVFHLAAVVGVRRVLADPAGTIQINMHGTEVVLDECSKSGTRLLLASSSEVYGKGEQATFREDDDLRFGPTTKARWSYACSKAIEEFLALACFKARGLPVTIARFFNIAGPRQAGTYGMVVPRFVQQALEGGPITVYGEGQQVRCFMHVREMVEVLWRLACCEEAIGEIVNVGVDDPVTINDLAAKVQALINPQAAIVHVPYEEAYGEGFEEVQCRVPNITKLRRLVPFEPQYDLARIVKDVAEYLSGEWSQLPCPL